MGNNVKKHVKRFDSDDSRLQGSIQLLTLLCVSDCVTRLMCNIIMVQASFLVIVMVSYTCGYSV